MKAVYLYQKASEKGSASAQSTLGLMYMEGDGVPKDLVLAYAWYNLAATNYEDAKKNRDLLEKKLTPLELAEAQQISSGWKKGKLLRRIGETGP